MAPSKRRRTAASTASAGTALATQSKLSFRSTKAGSKGTTSNVEGKSKILVPEEEDTEAVGRHSHTNEHGSEIDVWNNSKSAETDGNSSGIQKELLQQDEDEVNDDAAARAISNSDISRFWHAKEQERKAPRLHQEGLTTHDKVLREFDMTARFGPSIGITRLTRWRRAKELGMEPPFEVLSILLRNNQENGENSKQDSIVDELMMTSRDKYIIE